MIKARTVDLKIPIFLYLLPFSRVYKDQKLLPSDLKSQHPGISGEYFKLKIPSCGDCLFVCWLLNVPATCECISGTDLHRQFYVLPH